MKSSWIKRLPLFILFILLIFGMIWAFCACIDKVYGDRPIIVQNITHKQVNGSIIHGQIYEVMVFPGVDGEKVNDSLKLVSNQFGFILVPYDETRTYPSPWNNFDYAPFPKEDESFLILMIPRDDYPKVPAAGWTVPPYGRITVLVNQSYPSTLLAGIIEHECAHNIEEVNRLDYPDNPVYKYQFNQWMSDSWYGSELGVSSNVWSLLRNRWEIDTYLCAR